MYPSISWLRVWLRTQYDIEPAGRKMNENKLWRWRIERQGMKWGLKIRRNIFFIPYRPCAGPGRSSQLTPNLVWVCLLNKGINWELMGREHIPTQNPLFLPLATRTPILFRHPPITHMALMMATALLVQKLIPVSVTRSPVRHVLGM